MATTSKKVESPKQDNHPKPLIKTVANAKFIKRPGDEPERSHKFPHSAVPDQSMSIPEIVRRFVQGLPLSGTDQGEPYYDEDDDTPDFKRMDLAEQEEYLTERHNEAVLLRQKLRKKQNEDAQRIDKLSQEINEMRKKFEKPDEPKPEAQPK